MPRRHVGLALGVLSAAIMAACGQTSVPTTSTTQEEDHSEYATAALAAHSACENCSWDPEVPSVTAAMPSTTIVSGGHEFRISDAVVLGRFTGWSPGVASTWPAEEDRDKGLEVDWDSPNAETRRIKMDLAVDSIIDSHDTQLDDTVTVQLVVPGDRDAERAAEGLIDMGEVVVFLTPAPDTGDWMITMNGGFLGDVGADGTSVSMPIIEHLQETSDGSIFTGMELDATTIDDLENAAQNPQTITQ